MLRELLRSALLAALSAALLTLCFPPIAFGAVLGWISLMPLLFAICGSSVARAMALGVLFGTLSNLGVFNWLLSVPGIHWYQFALLDAVFALYPAAWCGLISRLELTKPTHACLAAASWVSLEYLRSHAGFLALPWATLAHTQVDDAWLLQSAAFFGEAGISFLVVLGNLAIYGVLRAGFRFSRVAIALPILAALVAGAVITLPAGGLTSRFTEVTALSTQYAAYGSQRIPSDQREARTLALLERGIPESGSLAVLPESAFVNLDREPQVVGTLARIAGAHGGALVIGVAQAAKFEQAPASPQSAPDLRVINGAWFFAPRAVAPLRYRKVRRLPFAEYQPFAASVAWPRSLVGKPREVVRGPGPQTFDVGDGLRVGPMICWESLFADHARSLARQGATVLTLLANEAWFGDSAASAQHNLSARLRAVETGRPIVVSSNFGQSVIIDRLGRIVVPSCSSGAACSGAHWVTARVLIGGPLTPYVRYGHLFALVCVAASVIAAVRAMTKLLMMKRDRDLTRVVLTAR